jgi:predicted DsbA family dithiol-disulfide isomerase
VSNRAVLKQALLDVGLNAEEALLKLDDDNSRYQVKSEEAYWQNAGVSSVPTIVFNRKSKVTGAQPVDVFKEVLSEIIEGS